MTPSSPAIDALNHAKINYELIPIALSETTPTAQDYKNTLNNDNTDKLFKTIVLKGDKTGIIVTLIPADKKIDYKQLALLTNNHKTTMIPNEDLLETTGYQRSYCSPIAMKDNFPLFIDDTANNHDFIYINAATHTALIKISLPELARLLPFTTAPITKS